MLGRRYETRRGKTDRKVSLQKSSSGSRLTIDTKNQERKPKLLFFVLFVKEKQSQEKKLGQGFRKENKERGILVKIQSKQSVFKLVQTNSNSLGGRVFALKCTWVVCWRVCASVFSLLLSGWKNPGRARQRVCHVCACVIGRLGEPPKKRGKKMDERENERKKGRKIKPK